MSLTRHAGVASRGKADELRYRSLMVFSSSPVAVVLFLATAPQVIPSCIRSPYVHDTRVTTADYEHEMTREQHEELLDAILRCEGKVILSGYPNKLYDRKLREWNHVDIRIDNKASSPKEKPIQTERLWMNY
jgi:hypothetical protein